MAHFAQIIYTKKIKKPFFHGIMRMSKNTVLGRENLGEAI
ncbi:MAG: hypothetical protein HHAS10_06590 [Candidatus Altimarinota bacterium]